MNNLELYLTEVLSYLKFYKLLKSLKIIGL